MLDVLDRPVWDCLVPAAIRDDIFLPEKMPSGGFADWETLDTDELRKERRKRRSKQGEVAWTTAIFDFFDFSDGEKKKGNTVPPPVFFELKNLPKAPTWTDKEIDDTWLPKAPSLAYDDYSIVGEGEDDGLETFGDSTLTDLESMAR